MTEPEPRIAQLIDAYAPPSPGLPDWDDVVRRAARPAARRPLITAPRILLIAAALAVLLAGSALAGVGPGRLLLGLVRDDEPAPAPVKHALAHVFHWPHGTHVHPRSSHGSSRRQTAVDALDERRAGQSCRSSKTGSRRSRDGGYCAGQRFVPGDDGSQGYSYSCVARAAPPRPAVSSRHRRPDGGATPASCTGIRGSWTAPLPPATARIVLVHRDGRRTLVPLLRSPRGGPAVLRRAAGARRPPRPADRARIGSWRLDANGRRIAAAALTRRNVHPLITTLERVPPRRRGGSGGVRIDPNDVPWASAEPRVSPLRSTARTGRARCLDVDFAADAAAQRAARASACAPPRAPGWSPPSTSTSGHTSPSARSRGPPRPCEMILRDGTVVPVPAHAGAYVAVIGNALFRSGQPARTARRPATPAATSWRATSSRLHRDFLDY